jgi:hypothetical protein
MTPRAIEEYRALRATIRQRGATRMWLFVTGLVGWAGLVIATAALAALPIATLLPLLVLTGLFEAILAVHVGVERIGRYLQVFYEEDQGDRGWEHVAMAYGGAFPGSGGDPLFVPVFIGATILNFVPVIIAEPVAIEIAFVGAAHFLFLVRILVGRHRASRQRVIDLERFEQLKLKENHAPTSGPARS